MITIGLDENKKYARFEDSAKFNKHKRSIGENLFFRANPPGGFTSNAFDFQYEGEKKAAHPRKMHVVGSSNPSLSNDSNDNVYGYETEALDNAANHRPVLRSRDLSRPIRDQDGGVKTAEPFGFSRQQQSRFAAALAQPALDLTTSERMRTPRYLDTGLFLV